MAFPDISCPPLEPLLEPVANVKPKPAKKPAKKPKRDRAWAKDKDGNVIDNLRKSKTNLFIRSNGKYYGRYQVFGKRHKKSFGKVTYAEAEEACEAWMRKLQGRDFEAFSTDVEANTLMGDCMDAVSKEEAPQDEEEKPDGISHDHLRFVKSRFKHIRKTWPELETMKPDEVTEDAVRDWVKRCEKKYAAATIKGSMLYLRLTFEYAEKHKILFANPMKAVRNPVLTAKKGERRNFGVDIFDLVLAEMRNNKHEMCHRAADLAELLATTGARVSEIVGKKKDKLPGLKWKDVDFKNEQITIYGAKFRRKKTSEPTPRTIPFHSRLKNVLERLHKKPHEPGDLVSPASTAKKSLFGAAKRLHAKGIVKFDKLSAHDLRHLFSTRAVEKGIDIPTVAALLGHRDGGVMLLKTYHHVRNPHLHNAIKKLG